MHVVVTGGKTGGHVFPALSIAKEFLDKNNATKVTYAATKLGLGEKKAREQNIPYYALSVKPFVRTNIFQKVFSLSYLFISTLKASYFILHGKVDIVIGVGGYVSVPICLAAYILGKKYYICEQNVVPGLANRILAKKAQKIFISFEESRKYFPRNKCIISGNPIRKNFHAPRKNDLDGPFKILISGGSQGANFLNKKLLYVLKSLKNDCPNIKITHQCGTKDYEWLIGAYKKANINAHVVQFIEDMPNAFSNHSLLISRAGATTIAEIMAAGMPSILIPYPFASDDHQKYNARALVKKRAALMIEQSNDFESRLVLTLTRLYQNRSELELLSDNARSIRKINATQIITQEILGLETKDGNKLHI